MAIESKQDNTALYIGLAAIAVVYFGIIRPTTNALGFTTSAADEAAAQAAQGNLNALAQQIIATQAPTKSAYEWQTIADQIYQDLRYSSMDDNKADATYQVCRVQNDADVVLLIQKFGFRQEYFFGLPNGGKQNLMSFITGNLSDTQLNTIRGNHNRKGIKIKIV